MIGKPEWFSRRKYGGWGVMPKTWQGWAYVAVFIGFFLLVSALPLPGQYGTITMLVVVGIMCIDLAHIVVSMPKDERERIHEAVAERNALWIVIAVLTAGVGYQAAVSTINHGFEIDPVILVALAAGVITKAISNIYLDRRD